MAGGRLRVATYNIHSAVGRDRRFEPERVAAVVRELDATVVGLQEVPEAAALHRLADAAGFGMVTPPSLRQAGCHFGNAVLTTLPVLEVTPIDLSVPGREPRNALDVRLDAGGRDVRLLSTHLGLRPGERRHQIRRLLGHLEQEPEAALTLLLGDLNEWLLWGRPLRWLARWFEATPAPATFPAHFPFLALDRVWVRPRARLVSLATHRSPLARVASDHLPLLAVVATRAGDA